MAMKFSPDETELPNSYTAISSGTEKGNLQVNIKNFPFRFIYLFFKSLTHSIEDERVDSRVNVTHRVSNNLIKTII